VQRDTACSRPRVRYDGRGPFLAHWGGTCLPHDQLQSRHRHSRRLFFCARGTPALACALSWRRRRRLEPPAPLTEPPVAEEGPNLAPAPFVRIGPGLFKPAFRGGRFLGRPPGSTAHSCPQRWSLAGKSWPAWAKPSTMGRGQRRPQRLRATPDLSKFGETDFTDHR